MFSDLEQLLFNNSEVLDYLKKETEREKTEEPIVSEAEFKEMLSMHYNINADVLENLFKKEAFKDLTPSQINDILTDRFRKLFPVQNTHSENERARIEKNNYNNFLKTLNGI